MRQTILLITALGLTAVFFFMLGSQSNVAEENLQTKVAETIETIPTKEFPNPVTDKTHTATLTEGDTLTLSNNISIEVVSLSQESDTLNIEMLHYITDDNGTTFPINVEDSPKTHKLTLGDSSKNWNEDYAYKIKLKEINGESFTAELTALSEWLNSPKDLYDDCMSSKDDHDTCYIYSLYEPVQGEIQLQSEHFIVIGPEYSQSYMEFMSSQFEYCYTDMMDYLQIDEEIPFFPVRILPSDNSSGGAVGDNGMKLLGPERMLSRDNSSKTASTNFCDNSLLSHELVHAAMRGTPLSSVFNEGLATYYSVVVKHPILICKADGYIYRDNEKVEFAVLNKGGRLQTEQYHTGACFWDEYVKDNGYNVFLETIQVLKEADGQQISTLDLINEALGIDFTEARSKYGFTSNSEKNFQQAQKATANKWLE